MLTKAVNHKVIDMRTASRCFLAGSLATTSILIAYFAHNEMIALFMGIFLTWSMLMLFDAVFPFERRFHGITGLISLVTGITLAIVMSPAMHLYFIIIIVLVGILYMKRIKGLMGRSAKGKKSRENEEDI